MTQIKAAFFDIDGTLLPFHAKALPESTVQALAALRKNGVKTFIATGRPTASCCTPSTSRRHRCKRCCRTLKKNSCPSVL